MNADQSIGIDIHVGLMLIYSQILFTSKFPMNVKKMIKTR